METTRRPSWRQTEKQYFLEDPSKLCFIEENPDISGSPLWPSDSSFDAERITTNLNAAQETLKKIGGFVFARHLVLNGERELDSENLCWQENPSKLSTTFVSGFLLPRSRISASRIGFYPKEGEIPSLKESVKNLKGTWLASNLGYFITSKLIRQLNSRHPKEEHLQESDNSYLGGYFVRQKDGMIAYPPHFGTCGVGITKNGEPVLVNDVRLGGGTIEIGDQKFKWSEVDVNPKSADGKQLVVYTPSHNLETIGKNRINVVVVNEGQGTYPAPKIAYIKDGELRQPAGAVVFSFPSSRRKSGSSRDWIPASAGMTVKFEFEPWFDEKLWNSLDCFYEGLMELSLDGHHNFKDWLHPNAVLTQETFIPNPLRREPRNILIETEKYFGSFAFSGRYEHSLGISFDEIIPALKNILNQLAPKQNLKKVFSLDGGSGAKLCLVKNGEVGALNWVAPGMRNRLGDPNGNTYSCLLLNIGDQ
ncbi:MAG: hypothetical protein Q8P84_08800 [Deltaproteobacteria bacterium]|nr:hypothetical protein [Deltaproteobacteria bacterium]